MKIVKIIIIILLFAAAMNPAAAYTITVTVKDAEGNPIQGANVKVAYEEAKTNAEGIAVLEIPQQYTVPISLVVTKDGYESYGTVLNPPYPDEVDVFLYSTETAYIKGTVYFNSIDNPAGPGYVIEVFDAILNESIGFTVTDENSQFEFEVSLDRTCILVVTEYPGQRFEAKPGEDIDIIIETTSRPAVSILFQSGVDFEPGSVIVVGVEANQMDGVTALQVRSALLTWIGETDPRVSDKVAGFEERYNETSTSILAELESVEIANDDMNIEKNGFFSVLVGGPEVNATALRYNSMLSTKFIEDRSLLNKWYIEEPGGFSYKDSKYGIIALIPIYPRLDDSAIHTITGGDKRLCMLVIAGNAREGTYAAGIKLKEILKEGKEGRELLNELDKLLIWIFLGEAQTIQPVTIVVKYEDEKTASIVDVLIG
jgi:hypothetical protein